MNTAFFLVGLAALCYVIWQYGVPSSLGRGVNAKPRG